MTEEEIEEEKLSEVVHKVKKGKRKPNMISREMTGGNRYREEEKARMLKPKREPREEEKKKMIGIMIETMVKVIMENHLYKFLGGNKTTRTPRGDIKDCDGTVGQKTGKEVKRRSRNNHGDVQEVHRRHEHSDKSDKKQEGRQRR